MSFQSNLNLRSSTKTGLFPAVLLISLLGAVAFQYSVAGEIKSGKPWIEKSLNNHVEQSDFAGNLSRKSLKDLAAKGEALFGAKFTSLDGVGRPLATHAIIPTKRRHPNQKLFNRISGLDANSCSSCHNEPRIGGAGSFSLNVFASEGFTGQGADSTDPQFSNERNTNHLFGAGLIELLAREMTAELHSLRKKVLREARASDRDQTVKLVAKGVDFGSLTASANGLIDLSNIQGIDTDLVIRPFTQKGVITSLRQFTVNALNQHHGMQASERFGQRWTGESDFDGDGIINEISPGDVSALVAWQATLAPPVISKPENILWQKAAAKGEQLFDHLNCTSCHIRSLPLDSLKFSDPGPLDAAGTLRQSDSNNSAIYDLAKTDWAASLSRNSAGQILVPLFGDLKRHVMSDGEILKLGNELLSQRFVARNEFITGELWGVASTMPYGHRGDMTTLEEVITAHGGEARESRDMYRKLSPQDRQNIIAYLKTMVIKQ
jgi:cytochrome c peroxidase